MRDDKAMMSSPDRWPRWPWLPMKRHVNGHSDLDLGLLHADAFPDQPCKIYKGNLFEGKLHYFPLADQAFWSEYPNFDAVLADGWIVD